MLIELGSHPIIWDCSNQQSKSPLPSESLYTQDLNASLVTQLRITVILGDGTEPHLRQNDSLGIVSPHHFHLTADIHTSHLPDRRLWRQEQFVSPFSSPGTSVQRRKDLRNTPQLENHLEQYLHPTYRNHTTLPWRWGELLSVRNRRAGPAGDPDPLTGAVALQCQQETGPPWNGGAL